MLKTVSYDFMMVEWPSLEEAGQFGCFTGGTVSWGALTQLKVSGKLKYEGAEEPNAAYMVRLYATIDDGASEAARKPLATMFLDYAMPKETPSGKSGTVTCYSALQAAQEYYFGYPYTVQAGSNAVLKAAELLSSVGLQIGTMADSDYVLASSHTFEPDDSLLTMANWLLSAAGFASTGVDQIGRCVLQRYIEPSNRMVSWEFAGGKDSELGTEINTKNDIMKAPNIVVAYHEGQDVSAWASAENVGRNSKTSTDTTHRKRVERIDVQEVSYTAQSGETNGQALVRALKQKAAEKLKSESQEIEYKEFSISYRPVMLDQGIRIQYGDTDWSGFVTSTELEISAKARLKISARRFKDNDIEVAFDGGVLYEA